MSNGPFAPGARSIPGPPGLTSGVLAEWVTPDDLLIVQVRNALAGVTLGLNGRLWHPDAGVKEINLSMTPTSDRSLNTFSQQLFYGYLVSLAIKATGGSPHRGQTLAEMLLARPPASSFTPKMELAQDYVTTSYGPLWPGGRQTLGVEGPGMLYSIAVPNPAAGVDWTQTVPTGARWLLHGIYATLTTAVAAGNRQPLLVLDDGVNRLTAQNTALVQAGSLANDWTWDPGNPTTGVFANSVNDIDLPFPVPLFAGYRVRTVTLALQAADQWSGIRLLVEEWLED